MPRNQDDLSKNFSEKVARVVAASRNVGKQPDINTATEVEELQKQAEVRGLNQDIEERKKYAMYFFVLSCVWLLLVAVLLLVQGFGLGHFRLGESVILAAIGATTVNVLGILYVVANYLFPKK